MTRKYKVVRLGAAAEVSPIIQWDEHLRSMSISFEDATRAMKQWQVAMAKAREVQAEAFNRAFDAMVMDHHVDECKPKKPKPAYAKLIEKQQRRRWRRG